jgi:type II secretory pathway pseudopilin PulG
MQDDLGSMPRSFPPRPGSRGFTILELVTVLLLMGFSLGSLLPAARRHLDRFAVLGAREEMAGLFHRARSDAVAFGGATLHLDSDSAAATLLAGGEEVDHVAFMEEYRVSLVLSNDRREAELNFDPLGLGRVASQTLRFLRGEAEARLVVSSLGRVVRE